MTGRGRGASRGVGAQSSRGREATTATGARRHTAITRLAAAVVELDENEDAWDEPEGDPFDESDWPREDDLADCDASADVDDPDDEPNPRRSATRATILFREKEPTSRGPSRHLLAGISVMSVRIRRTSIAFEEDPITATRQRARELWLQRVAEALMAQQGAALRAASPANAFLELRPMTQASLADAADTSAFELSRNASLRVGTTLGVQLPLEFFWWRKPDQDALIAPLRRLHRLLRQDPDVPALAAARAATSDAGMAESLRKLVPALRAVAEKPHVVERHRLRFPAVDAAALLRDLGVAGGRGAVVAHAALVGLLLVED